MSTTRIYPHHSLPAPVVHATFSISQSKSHVLAGVQDAYWSDDEAVRIQDYLANHLLITRLMMLVIAGRCRMPTLSRGNGHFGSQFQTVRLRLPGELSRFSPKKSSADNIHFPQDLSVLLASYQRKFE